MPSKNLCTIIKTHFVDSTAILVATNPIWATFENFIIGMPDEVSLNARLIASGMAYAGLGSIFSRGRDLSKYLFKINEDSSSKIQWVHDTSYLSELIYYFCQQCIQFLEQVHQILFKALLLAWV